MHVKPQTCHTKMPLFSCIYFTSHHCMWEEFFTWRKILISGLMPLVCHCPWHPVITAAEHDVLESMTSLSLKYSLEWNTFVPFLKIFSVAPCVLFQKHICRFIFSNTFRAAFAKFSLMVYKGMIYQVFALLVWHLLVQQFPTLFFPQEVILRITSKTEFEKRKQEQQKKNTLSFGC